MGIHWANIATAGAAAGSLATAVALGWIAGKTRTASEVQAKATTDAARAADASARAAESAAKTADTLARIEVDRRHAELAPHFEVTCREVMAGGHALMRLALAGPVGLNGLDSIKVRIRDDMHDRGPTPTGNATAEEIAAVVWGPYRFTPGVNGADESGRTVAPVALQVGDWTQFALESSHAPRWVSEPSWWRSEYEGTPIRISITCSREGQEPWTIPLEIDVDKARTS